jgi:hypothetical protein
MFQDLSGPAGKQVRNGIDSGDSLCESVSLRVDPWFKTVVALDERRRACGGHRLPLQILFLRRSNAFEMNRRGHARVKWQREKIDL